MFWSGAQLATAGDGIGIYDPARFAAVQETLGIADWHGLPPYHWVYPPHLLLLVVPLAWVPYVVGLTIWVLAAFGFYLLVVRRILGDNADWWLALLPYGVAIALYEGQVSFLLAGFLGLTLHCMPTRPLVAGLFLGVLSFKPQYGPLFPVVLLLTGRWRMLVAATATVFMLVLLSGWTYGLGIWELFLRSMAATNPAHLQPVEGTVVLHQTAFGVMSWLGASPLWEWTTHLLFATTMAAAACRVARRPTATALHSAAIGIGVLAVTPYMIAYDLLAIAISGAFLLRDCRDRGILPGERALLAASVFVLLFSFHVPVGPFVLAALMWAVLRRARLMPIG